MSSGQEIVSYGPRGIDSTYAIRSLETPIAVMTAREDVRFQDAAFDTSIRFALSRSGLYPRGRGGAEVAFTDVCGSPATISHTLDSSNAHRAVACFDQRVYSSVVDGGRVNVGHAISSLAIDDQGNVFVIDQSIAQITRLDRQGGVTTVGLTNAAPGTTANERMLPRAIRYEPGIDMLVLFTKGTNTNGRPDIYLIEAFRE